MLMHRGNKEAFKAVYIKAAWQRCMRYYGKWHWLKRVDPQMVGGRNMNDYDLIQPGWITLFYS
jgi:hypothetical protein